ncbi:AraC family transcriptional regulator [Microbacterium sp. NPDC077644]|uniref:AraC family transcriptional regulator n=1 Tax=Microbacterium sp. NPDC077644 TaxID=3155055 RepID=UPI00344F57D1
MGRPIGAEPPSAGPLHLFGVDAAVKAGSTLFYPHELDSFGARSLNLTLTSVDLDAVTIATISYNARVRISTEELTDGYQFNVPLHASLSTSVDGRRSLLFPNRGAVYGPTETSAIEGWQIPDTMLAVKFRRETLEAHLAGMTGRSLNRLIPFNSHLDLTGAAARQWLGTTRLLFSHGRTSGGLFGHPLMMRSASQALMTGFLIAAYPESLSSEHSEIAPPVVRRALEIIDDAPQDVVSVVELARAVGVSARALQAAFREHLSESPGQYVRRARLRGAHRDLLAPEVTSSVASVAAKWGFAHLGRFADSYAREYGQLPSETLRRARF